jgi:CubicO group peptidase (beta-lactamase class C family)
VRNPAYPDANVTLRMLLAHVASITDSDALFDTWVWNTPTTTTLEQLMRGYFTPRGLFYRSDNFGAWEPESRYDYSNAGIDLAGLLVERASGVAFDAYCKSHIFAPLGMNESSYRLAGLDRSHIAMQYDTDGVTEFGLEDYADYPDGELRTSVDQLARFLLMFMNDGTLDGAQVLRASTVAEMRREQAPGVAPGQGLVWYAEEHAGRAVIGHNGASYGVSTIMGYDPETLVGAIVLSNGNMHMSDGPASDVFGALFDHLLEVGEAL